MRALVYGSGPVAVVTGYLFSRAGYDVRHLQPPCCGSPVTGAARLKLVEGSGSPPAHTAYEVLPHVPSDERYDLAVVTGEQSDLPAALELTAALGGRPRVLLATGLWDQQAAVDAELTRDCYVWVQPLVAARRRPDGSIEGVPAGAPRIGAASGERTEASETAARALASAGLQPRDEPAITAWLRTRYAVEAGLASAAKAGLTDSPLRSREALRAALRAAQEALRVAERAGVDVTAFADARLVFLPERGARVALRAIFRRDPALARYLEVRSASGRARERVTDVLETATRLGVATPSLRDAAVETAPASRLRGAA